MKRVRTGEIHLANLEPVRGSEQGRARPVIVFQNPDLSAFTSTALCVPLTTNLGRLGLPGTCMLRAGDGGLHQDCVALGFQMRALDVSRLGRRLGSISLESVELLAEALLNALGISFLP